MFSSAMSTKQAIIQTSFNSTNIRQATVEIGNMKWQVTFKSRRNVTQNVERNLVSRIKKGREVYVDKGDINLNGA
jgi:hypothetical protein